jgi:hypothetical protein
MFRLTRVIVRLRSEPFGFAKALCFHSVAAAAAAAAVVVVVVVVVAASMV